MPLAHTNLSLLINGKLLDEMEKLWVIGQFQQVLAKIELLNWDDLLHALVIFSLTKVMTLDRNKIMDLYGLTPDQYSEIEIQLINEKINQSKGY